MALKLKPYPEYKESGVPWLGIIPKHWFAIPLKHVARVNPSKSEAKNFREANAQVVFLPMERVGTDGQVNATEIRPIIELWSGLTYFRRSDVLVAKITPCFENGKGACLTTLPTDVGFGSTEFIVLRSRNRISPEFLYRVTTFSAFRALGADAMTGAAGQQRVPLEFVKDFICGLPPLEEQVVIIRFLKRMDSLFKRLIRSKRRLIELLNEQKQAIIHHAVTRGLDPNVRLKPSDIEWLGDVPEHWEVKRLGHFITLQRGFDITKDQQIGGQIPVVSSGGVASYHNQYTSNGPGVLIGRKGSVGSVHFVESDYWAHDTTLWVKEFNDNHPKFIYYFLRTLELKKFDTGSANPTLNRNIIHPEPVSLPPVNEQRTIASFLDHISRRLDKLVGDTVHQIDLLREYRTRLIADVVTGKLDVTGVKLPESEVETDFFDDCGGNEPEIDGVTEIDAVEGLDE